MPLVVGALTWVQVQVTVALAGEVRGGLSSRRASRGMAGRGVARVIRRVVPAAGVMVAVVAVAVAVAEWRWHGTLPQNAH